jgi:hypothetical protein
VQLLYRKKEKGLIKAKVDTTCVYCGDWGWCKEETCGFETFLKWCIVLVNWMNGSAQKLMEIYSHCFFLYTFKKALDIYIKLTVKMYHDVYDIVYCSIIYDPVSF